MPFIGVIVTAGESVICLAEARVMTQRPVIVEAMAMYLAFIAKSPSGSGSVWFCASHPGRSGCESIAIPARTKTAGETRHGGQDRRRNRGRNRSHGGVRSAGRPRCRLLPRVSVPRRKNGGNNDVFGNEEAAGARQHARFPFAAGRVKLRCGAVQ